jgi:hypothetical protein
MSGGGGGHAAPPAAGKPASAAPSKDPYIDLAERIFIGLAARVYGTLAGGDMKKPDPKALATFSFKLADAFEQATSETPRKLAETEARNKAAVKLDDVDVSSFIGKK